MNLCMWVAELAGRGAGIAPGFQLIQLDTLLGVRGVVPWLLGSQPTTSLVHGPGFVFLLFLLSLVLRGERRAAVGAFLIFFGGLTLQGLPAFALLFFGLLAASYIFVAARFGLLAVAAGQFVFFMVEFYPYTADPSAWYSGVTLFAASVIAALALYGFRASLAGRPLLRGRLLED